MFKRVAIPAVLTLLSYVSAYANGAGDGLVVDGERIKGYIAYLSTDAMEGRMTCTEGYRKAADWVAGRFQEWGLRPAGEDGTYFQKVTIREFDWNTGVPALQVGGREFLFDDADYSVDALSTPASTQQGQIVFVGYGIAAPEKGLNEYDGLDVEGEIVLAFKGSPKDAPQLQRRFFRDEGAPGEKKEDREQEDWSDESTDLSKMKTAYEKGAAAVLLYDPGESRESGAWRARPSRRSGKGSWKPERSFLCFTIRERVFRAIMKRDPQESPQGLKRRMDGVRRAIKEKKVQSCKTGVQASLKGYDVSIRYDEENGNNEGRNVLAKIEGTDPELKDECVLVGAHLDHIGVRNGYVYNGADDNASGSGVVLEVARVLSEGKFRPKRTLVFCCWCGEERGLLGSTHYASRPCGGVALDKVVAYFNIDMVGMGEFLGAPGALNFPTIWAVIKRGQHPDIVKRVKPRTGGPGGSDHTPFIKRGIESLALMSGGGVGHQDYHQPEDDVGKIEPEMLRVTGQFVLQGMVNLANETKAKLLIERREQLYRAMRMQISNFNPDLPNSLWSVVPLDKKSKEELYDEIYDRARELLKGSPSSRGSSGASKAGDPRSRGKKSLARGLADLKLIGDDVRLLKLVVDFHGVGRVDIKGDDGVWVANGRLTDEGREALSALEQSGVAARLISPGEKLINDMLSAASKPFVITGDYDIAYDHVSRLNDRGVQLGIDFDPQKVEDFLARVEKARKQLGERRNLFAFLTAAKKLDEAKEPLYLGLIDRGWTHNEICGGREHRGLVGGANLSALDGRADRSR
jgi:hypothetical protein